MRTFVLCFLLFGSCLIAAPAPIIVDSFSISSFTGTSSASGTTIQISNGSSVNFQNQSTAGNASISIDGTSQLNFSQSAASTYSGPLTGSGTVTKNGTGDLTMTGNNTPFSGPLFVQVGTLYLNGTYGGSVTVSPTAAIVYGGAISGNLVVDSGTITTLGTKTLNVGGSYTQSGTGTYIVNLSSSGQSSLINVAAGANVGGFVALDTSGGVLFHHQYTIVHANSGVTGTYTLSGSYPSLGLFITYDGNNVYLSFGQSFSTIAQTNNEKVIATQLDGITNPTPDEAIVLGAFSSLDPEQARQALNEMSGEQYTDLFFIALNEDVRFSRRIYNAYREEINPCAKRCTGLNTWVSGGVGRGFQKGRTGAAGFDESNYDVSFGVHSCVSGSFLLGGALGYEADFVHSSLGGKSDLKTGQAAIYSAYQNRRVYLLTELIGARTWSDCRRPIAFGSLNRTAIGKPHLNHGKFEVEFGGQFGGCHFSAQPFVAGGLQLIQQQSIREVGADSLNLSFESFKRLIGNTFVGCHFNFNYSPSLKASLDLAWQHDYGNLAGSEYGSFQQFGSSFFIEGPKRGHDGAIGALFLSGPLSSHWDIYVQALGELWKNWHAFAFNGGISYRW